MGPRPMTTRQHCCICCDVTADPPVEYDLCRALRGLHNHKYDTPGDIRKAQSELNV